MEAYPIHLHVWPWWSWPQPLTLGEHVTQPWLITIFQYPGHQTQLRMGMDQSAWLTLFLGALEKRPLGMEPILRLQSWEMIKNHILMSSVLIWLLLKAEPEMRTWVRVVWNVLPGRSEEVGRMKRKKRKSPFKGVFSCFSTMPNRAQVCILSDPGLLWRCRNLLSLKASAVQKCGQDPIAESFSLLTLQWTNLRGVIMSQQTRQIEMGLWI